MKHFNVLPKGVRNIYGSLRKNHRLCRVKNEHPLSCTGCFFKPGHVWNFIKWLVFGEFNPKWEIILPSNCASTKNFVWQKKSFLKYLRFEDDEWWMIKWIIKKRICGINPQNETFHISKSQNFKIKNEMQVLCHYIEFGWFD